MERPDVYGWCDTDWTDTLDVPTVSDDTANDGAASSVSSWHDLDLDRPEGFPQVYTHLALLPAIAIAVCRTSPFLDLVA